MPEDQSDRDARLSQLRADLKYYTAAVAGMRVGDQPPSIYADKYVADLGYLLDVVDPAKVEAVKPPPSELEVALRDDAAGRVERKSDR